MNRPRFPLDLRRVAPAAAPASAPRRPDGPLQAEAPAPSRGLGLDSAQVRARMVRRLRADGICDEKVLAALDTVARHRFVDAALANQAYVDTSLPIGLGQTISQPWVVARMLERLGAGARARELGHLGRVLEVGTGCGYQTALLALLARHVVSVERLRPLFDKAAGNLADYRAGDRIRLVWGDGRLGHAPLAPYDSIIAAAGGDDVPQAWYEQLAIGGRLIAPVADAGSSRAAQSLLVVDRHATGYDLQRHEGVIFVPLKSGVE